MESIVVLGFFIVIYVIADWLKERTCYRSTTNQQPTVILTPKGRTTKTIRHAHNVRRTLC